MANIGGMRHPYHGINVVFDINDLASLDPFEQFQAWFDDARNTEGIMEANAMALATCTKAGMPSVRMLLLKGFSEKGFQFFTNYNSRKAQELEENPNCCIMFYWEHIKRSVRIEGSVEKLTEKESEEYFQSRPKPSQIGALVSDQSSVIASRQASVGPPIRPLAASLQEMVLTDKNEELHKLYDGDTPVPKPGYWGGYLVKPNKYEFWQGQTNRLHDRLQFRRLQNGEKFDETVMKQGTNGWVIERLSS